MDVGITCTQTHLQNMRGTNGKNRLFFGYMPTWPPLPPLMHLICHNESLGRNDRQVGRVVQGRTQT